MEPKLDVPLHYRTAGEGPPLLLIHGAAEDVGHADPAGRGVRRPRATG